MTGQLGHDGGCHVAKREFLGRRGLWGRAQLVELAVDGKALEIADFFFQGLHLELLSDFLVQHVYSTDSKTSNISEQFCALSLSSPTALCLVNVTG